MKSLIKKYFYDVGGKRTLISLIIIMLIWMSVIISSNFFVAYWVVQEDAASLHYFIYYFIITLVIGLFELARLHTIAFKNFSGIQKLFVRLTNKLFCAPITKFFERITVGKILKRYS